MRDALGNRLPAAQASRLRSILDEKDEAQYGTRVKSIPEAESLLDKLETFAEWAETELDSDQQWRRHVVYGDLNVTSAV
ncbi:hypothetical protein NKJ28_23445 [Mesorhizobium sp. M0145]|uniref:hypothetical protein n=1 Tax=unclassified Mesorhizobium TaxID=325217 RepID=UPI00333589C7